MSPRTVHAVAAPAGVARRPASRPVAPRPPARAARAALFATVCASLAVAGHVAAGRAAVAPRAVVVGFVALYLVAWVLTGTERSLATILGGLLGGQFMLHALFAAAAAPATMMAGGHPMPAAPGMPGAAIPAAPAAGDAALGGGWTMTIAHVAAALVAAWWLRRGERAAWTLARRTAALAAHPLRALRALVAPLDAAPPHAPVGTAGAYGSPRLIEPTGVMLRGSVTRRGPPFGSTITCP
jgi:hypothetical protein